MSGVEVSVKRPGRFIPREIALLTNWIGGWEGRTTGLEDMEKSLFPARKYSDTVLAALRAFGIRCTEAGWTADRVWTLRRGATLVSAGGRIPAV
jgi:hypothetical protein